MTPPSQSAEDLALPSVPQSTLINTEEIINIFSKLPRKVDLGI